MQPDFQIPARDNPTLSGTVSGFSTIAGFTITMSAKEKPTDPNPLFTVNIQIIDPVAGTIAIPLTSVMTDQAENFYYYDIKVVDTSGVTRHTKRSVFEITEPIT